jgi:hypothetical protein
LQIVHGTRGAFLQCVHCTRGTFLQCPCYSWGLFTRCSCYSWGLFRKCPCYSWGLFTKSMLFVGIFTKCPWYSWGLFLAPTGMFYEWLCHRWSRDSHRQSKITFCLVVRIQHVRFGQNVAHTSNLRLQTSL